MLHCSTARKLWTFFESKFILLASKMLHFTLFQNHGVATDLMENIYIHERIRAVKRTLVSSSHKWLFWNDTRGDLPKIFVDLLKIYWYKTATTLISSSLVSYLIHSIILKSSLSNRRFLIDNGKKLLGFLPVGTTYSLIVGEIIFGGEEELKQEPAAKPLEDYRAPTSRRGGRRKKWRLCKDH